MKKVFNLFGQGSILPKMNTHFRRLSLKDISKLSFALDFIHSNFK